MKIIKPIKGIEKAIAEIEKSGEKLTYAGIAKKLKIPYQQIYNYVFLDQHETIDADVFKLLDGRKMTEIAKELNVSKQAVYQVVVRFVNEGRAEKINKKYRRIEDEYKNN